MVSSLGSNSHNKRLKRDCQRVAFPVPMSRRVVTVLCLSFVVMRCGGKCVASPLGGRIPMQSLEFP
ncbi:Uncharacterised protein [Vibrio cholerae]|nr:Uncharacterised protein [Vibrio cholerae]